MDQSSDEQLLTNALNMDHEQAKRIVQTFFEGERKELAERQELAFAHIYNCIEIECIKFWQEMKAKHTDSGSQEVLLKHRHLAKIHSESIQRQYPQLNPFWHRRN